MIYSARTPKNYVKQWPLGLFLEVLRHHFSYIWAPGSITYFHIPQTHTIGAFSGLFMKRRGWRIRARAAEVRDCVQRGARQGRDAVHAACMYCRSYGPLVWAPKSEAL